MNIQALTGAPPGRLNPPPPSFYTPGMAKSPLGRLKSLTDRRVDVRKGIYILPSLFTIGSILLSFTAIAMVVDVEEPTRGFFRQLGVLILFAAFLDTFDGIVARLTHTQSEFGAQLDSLADVISFGIAPAVIMYAWAFHYWGSRGYLLSFLLLITGAIRLARFNASLGNTDKRFFIGFPIPAQAMVLLNTMVLFPGLTNTWVGVIFITMLAVLLSFLMVSSVHFRTFKEINWGGRVPVKVVLFLTVVMCLIAVDWDITFFLLSWGYLGSGLFSRYLPEQWDWKRVRSSVESLDEALDDAIGLDLDESSLDGDQQDAGPEDPADEAPKKPGKKKG